MNKDHEIQRSKLREVSISIILENQHPTGGFTASPTFSQYGYSWLRDGTYIAYSLLRIGRFDAVRAYIQWVADVIGRYDFKIDQLAGLLESGLPKQNNWFLSARYTLEGKEDTSDWPNFQIDGYGSWLWLTGEYLRARNEAIPSDWSTRAEAVVTYLELVWSLPNSDCWEEFNGHIHPATLACLVGGLRNMTPYLDSPWCSRSEQLATTITDYIMKNTHKGGYFPKYIGAEMIDASLVWLSVPYGVVKPDHPLMKRTIEKIEQEITYEGGVRRYPQDTYYGGGQWIILSAFLGWYYLRVGNPQRAEELMKWILRQQANDGLLPEQVLVQVNDPSMIDPWEKRWGPVATPLLWSHAMFLILDNELSVYTHKGGE